MKKILYFVPEDYGFVSHRLQLATQAIAEGYKVFVVTRINRHADIIKSSGFELFELGNKDSRRHKNNFWKLLKLISIYWSVKPDVVHHFGLRMVAFGTLAAKTRKGIRIVNTITGLGSIFIYTDPKYRILRLFIVMVLRVLARNTIVTVQNRDDYEFIKKMSIRNIELHLVLGTGIDVERFRPQQKLSSVPAIILPARMLRHKGIEEFVEASRQLMREGVDCRFILVGDDDRSNLSSINRDQLFRWEKEGCVEWWGHKEDMSAVLAGADIVCLPTYREGLPRSLLEAASCGIPIVATDVPGCREIVDHGINGFLVPARNPAALAKAVKELVLNKRLRVKMGRGGREKTLRSFSSEIIVAQNMELYADRRLDVIRKGSGCSRQT